MPTQERTHNFGVGQFGDIVRVRIRRIGGSVEGFTVQLELTIDGDYVPAVRWDTAHGFAHRDHLRWDGSTHHWDRMANESDFNVSLTEAITDVRKNSERYRSDFFHRKNERQ